MTTDAEIIEDMARKDWPGLFSESEQIARYAAAPYPIEVQRELVRNRMRKLLAIIAPAIRAQAMEEAAKVAEWAHMVPPDGGSPSEAEYEVAKEAARRIRALAPPAVAETLVDRISDAELAAAIADDDSPDSVFVGCAPPAVAEKGSK